MLRATVVSILLFASLLAPTAAAQAPLPPQAPVARYIVVLQDAVGDPGAVAQEHASAFGLQVAFVYRAALRGYAAVIPAQRLAQVQRDPRVAFISPDREVQAFAQSTPTGVDRIDGDLSTTAAGDGAGTAGVPVAILDTGSGPHSDLDVAGGKNCSNGSGYSDGNGHGTHVAGTIGARDNTSGVVGIAPGTKLWSVRVLNASGSGSWSGIVCGIDWVTANGPAKGITVANMSLGGAGVDDGNCGNSNADALHRAICGSVAKGILYVVAAGNSGVDFAGSVPASYDEVLTVSAEADFNGLPGGGAPATCRSDVDETAADFSNFATPASADAGHTIAAPGVCINSTWKGGGYKTISGTSMASPHVAGAASLCLASGACAGLSPAGIVAKLRADATAQPTSYGYADGPTALNGRYYGDLTYAGGY